MPHYKVRYIACRRQQVPEQKLDQFLAYREDFKYASADTPNDAVSAVRDEVLPQIAADTQSSDGLQGVHDPEFTLVSVVAAY